MGREGVFEDKVKKVLVVDDEPLILRSLSRGLQGSSRDVTAVGSGEEALKEISSHSYEVCVLDLNLPGISGMEVLEFIREKSPATKVIVITASLLDEESRRYLEENTLKIIHKPFDLTEIKGTLFHVLSSQDKNYGDKEGPAERVEARERRDPRSPQGERVHYSINYIKEGLFQQIPLTGESVDISLGGMGMKTHFPLEKGIRIRFAKEMDGVQGEVKWTAPLEEGYRVGIQFL